MLIVKNGKNVKLYSHKGVPIYDKLDICFITEITRHDNQSSCENLQV